MIKIHSGITLPKKGALRQGRPPGPLSEALLAMRIGDSFLLPKGGRNNVRALARYYNIHIATRNISKDRIRVWRIKAAE